MHLCLLLILPSSLSFIISTDPNLQILKYILNMRQRTLTNKERSYIVTMREKKLKCKDIANVLQMPRSTVSIVLTKYRLTGSIQIKSTGHPKLKLTARALHHLARLVCDDRQQTLAMLADCFHVHRNTIRTYIRKLGFRNRIARQKPYLTIARKAKRLAFAKFTSSLD